MIVKHLYLPDRRSVCFNPGDHGTRQFWQSPLSLLVLRVHADHAHYALAVHDLALVAEFLD